MSATLLANRVAKARRFIDFLDANLPADVDVELLVHADWPHIAELAGEKTPSDATRSAIVTGLRERRRLQHTHPLEGLPR